VPTFSAGLLVYRVSDGGVLEVLIVHPGGPFWARRDDGVWSVPKGEVDTGADPAATAEREFAEELGTAPPPGPRIDLGEITQRGGKRVRVWAVSGDVDAARAGSNTFEMEWPPGSGTVRSFPEVDRAAWFTAAEARRKLLAAQGTFVDRLGRALADSGARLSMEDGGPSAQSPEG
jgi:predicted NUDIX family NTP pyrophosphohydrolase